ncbi:MAG: chemotaxis protein CheA, partial [Clostridiales bacterium]|nr:chemotaxis protein CheA [Clostridiales bacterium]
IHHYLDLVSRRKPKPAEGDQQEDCEEGDTDLGGDGAFYKIKVEFEAGCRMENMRAFGVVNAIGPMCAKKAHIPEDLMGGGAGEQIAKNGFIIYIQSAENQKDIKKVLNETMFLSSASIVPLAGDSEELPESMRPGQASSGGAASQAAQKPAEAAAKQNFISVNINKLDKLIALVGEIAATEATVTKNPEILAMNVSGFSTSAERLEKLTAELREVVMSIRMIPISSIFHKMTRIVRDMSKKTGKQVNLRLVGEETEVDKNIIDNLSDPLMHLIRNAVDHGLEQPAERLAKGKSAEGNLILEARSTGGDVMIIVSDDGSGLNRDDIIKTAAERGLAAKPSSKISDKEAFAMIFMPGFSTNTEVTEFSGRGVGMDVVRRNIEKLGGTICLDSTPSAGTTFTIRVPLAVAIMDEMKAQCRQPHIHCPDAGHTGVV